jgi:ParB family chromosome partitioning protein
MNTEKVNSENSMETKDMVSIELSKITVSGFNPRTTFNESDLRELADSIRQVGVLQPVLVRPKGRKFEIVCGERRFRASVLADTKTIPVIVRSLSDDDALEIAITENLQRETVSPIDEAAAYKRLADTGRYSVENLAVRFGKSETYVRNRMRLNELTDDLLNLVNQDALSVSVALELCKYSAETQAVIYEKHLQGNPNSLYNDWRSLTAKDFIKRLENSYSNDLSRYRFDKSECARCPFNTNCYCLFPDTNKEGKCLNLNCLTDRNKQFLLSSCQSIIMKHPDIEVCRPIYNNSHEDIYTELSEQGYTVDTKSVKSFPEAPVTPNHEDFEDESDFAEAKDEYYAEMAEFQSDMENIEQMLSTGKAKRTVTIIDNKPQIGYVIVQEEESAEATGKDNTDPAQKLEKQDKRNMEIAVENIVEDTRQLIRKTELPESDFTEFEDKLLYFSMLDDLKREHFALFLENPQEKWHLTDEDKIAIINNLTEEQKTVIRRDFLIKHLSDAFGISKKAYLMMEFARLHFPEALSETENKYNEVYRKRHERITERLEALKNAQETQKQEIIKVA